MRFLKLGICSPSLQIKFRGNLAAKQLVNRIYRGKFQYRAKLRDFNEFFLGLGSL